MNEFKDEFAVTKITPSYLGICQKTSYRTPQEPAFPDDSRSVDPSRDDFLVTFVLPGVIIASMFALAGIIACILYRRRRSGKMSISEIADERQSFRRKGIPVIFQDELDEKPDPGKINDALKMTNLI